MADDDPQELTQQRIEDLYSGLRKIGLYENKVKRFSAEEAPEGDVGSDYVTPDKKGTNREFVIMDLHVGDVAFSKRVQSPDQVDFDAQFAAMTREFEQNEMDEINQKIQRRLAEGKNPFGDD